MKKDEGLGTRGASVSPETAGSRKLKDLAHSLCFIGRSVLGVLIFFVLPFCVVVYYSVIKNSINPEFVFLDNFIALFKNSAFRDAAKNTATFSALAVPLAVVLRSGWPCCSRPGYPSRASSAPSSSAR